MRMKIIFQYIPYKLKRKEKNVNDIANINYITGYTTEIPIEEQCKIP